MAIGAIKRLAEDAEVLPGGRLGRYEVAGLLGAGGMGRVYRAVDTRLRREVAIKVLDRAAAANPLRRRRFEREAQLAGAVSHPNVVAVFDVDEWEGLPYVVSERLEGETLRERLRGGALAVGSAVDLGAQIAQGLAALHQRGIVHRDIKPENLFVTADGRLKILDLGLAGPSRSEGAPEPADDLAWETLTTEDGAGFGTAAYMSPEQVRRRPLDARSDIFACGVVLYEMLLGRRPFQEETAVETMTAILRRTPRALLTVDPSLPPALTRVVERCLEKDPERRFHSGHDLALALEASAMAAPLSPPAGPLALAPPSTRPSPARTRSVHLALAVAAALLPLAAVVAWRAASGSGGAPAAPPSVAEAPVAAAPAHAEAALRVFDAKTGRFVPFLGGLAAEGVDFSPDRRWVAYTTYPDGRLWRSRSDGTLAQPLTKPPLQAALPRWSPDGTRLAFAGRTPDGSWQVHVALAFKDAPSPWGPLPVENVTDPAWTPDGAALILGRVSGREAGLLRFDLRTGKAQPVQGSEGLFSPRLSPDGRFLAALRDGKTELLALDATTGEWTTLTDHSVSYPAWSRDGAWVHYRRSDGGASFHRIDPLRRVTEAVALAGEERLAGGEWGAWSGVTPEGAPILLADLRVDGPATTAIPAAGWSFAWAADQRRGADSVEVASDSLRKTSR
jgi:tRNA A-37 threonylcarbamoyl transferase component Bud32